MGAQRAFGHLALVRADHPGALLALFGHADPVGQDAPNKTLSGRRAIAVYAVLTRDTAAWETLYSKPAGSDQWGSPALDAMHIVLGRPGTSGTYDTAAQRAELFKAYMDLLCRDVDGKSYQLDPAKDFLGGGADADHRGACQGCSEFNPVVIFSEADANAFASQSDTTKRDEANAPNRRVVGLLFPAGTVIDLKKWPCPAPTTGVSACQKRFWSDAAHRRQNQAKERTFAADADTYACRFYQRLMTGLPCNGTGTLIVSRLLLQRFPGKGTDKTPPGIADVPYTVDVVGLSPREGKTGSDGGITVVMEPQSTVTVTMFDTVMKFNAPPALDAGDTLGGAQRRLDLLGYEPDVDGAMDRATDRAILQFQSDQGVDPDGDKPLTLTGKPSDDLVKRLHDQSGV